SSCLSCLAAASRSSPAMYAPTWTSWTSAVLLMEWSIFVIRRVTRKDPSHAQDDSHAVQSRQSFWTIHSRLNPAHEPVHERHRLTTGRAPLEVRRCPCGSALSCFLTCWAARQLTTTKCTDLEAVAAIAHEAPAPRGVDRRVDKGEPTAWIGTQFQPTALRRS